MKRRIIIALAMALILVAVLPLSALAEEETVTASVTVGEYISITTSGSIAFGSLSPGASESGATGQGDGIPAITIAVAPETNVNVDIGIKGAIATGSLALSNWKYSTSFVGTKTSIPSAYGTAAYSNVGVGSYFFYHWVTVPLGSTTGI